MSILSLFWTFFQFGLVSFGGGYVLVPLLIAEFVNRRGIISMDAFGNLVSIAQVTPGRSESTPQLMWASRRAASGERFSPVSGSSCRPSSSVLPQSTTSTNGKKNFWSKAF